MKDRAYQFPTPEHQCCACRGDLSPGGEFYSTICFLEEEFARRNYCVSCWVPEDPGPEEGGEGSGRVDRSGIFAYWRTRRPEEQDGEAVFRHKVANVYLEHDLSYVVDCSLDVVR